MALGILRRDASRHSGAFYVVFNMLFQIAYIYKTLEMRICYNANMFFFA